MNRSHRRFTRQVDRLGQMSPRLRTAFVAVTAPGRLWLRLPVSLLLIAGGVLGFLPVLGFWMLPLGLILLAIDLPLLRPLVGSGLVRLRAFFRRRRRR